MGNRNKEVSVTNSITLTRQLTNITGHYYIRLMGKRHTSNNVRCRRTNSEEVSLNAVAVKFLLEMQLLKPNKDHFSTIF